MKLQPFNSIFPWRQQHMIRHLAFRRCRGATEAAKRSKQEARRAETAMKRQKMREEEQRRKDKVKDRLDLIRQMKGDQQKTNEMI